MAVRYIFCINTGRSGSDYLAELLSKAENTISLHEPLPVMNGLPMRQFNNGNEIPMRALMPCKLKNIKKAAEHKRKIYCETNHIFIKGWGYLIPEFIPQDEIGIIVLRRDIEKTIHSLLRVRDVPGLTEYSNAWYLDPEAARNLSTLDPAATPYDRCNWYIKETFLRAEEYRNRFPKITYWDCDLEQLNNYEFVIRMFDHFALIPSPDLKYAVGKRLNVRLEWPKLSLPELLQESKYQRADELPHKKRDEILRQMVEYLLDNYHSDIASWKPNPAINGSLLNEAVRLVAVNEEKLENHFNIELKFTDMESTLYWELLHIVEPHDFMFLSLIRKTKPLIFYEFDLNFKPNIWLVIKRIGLVGLIRTLWLILIGKWRRESSHKSDRTEV